MFADCCRTSAARLLPTATCRAKSSTPVSSNADALRRAELERATRLLARGEDPHKVLEALSQGLTNKLIHAPTRFLNDAEGELHGDCAELVQRLFNLHRDHEPAGSGSAMPATAGPHPMKQRIRDKLDNLADRLQELDRLKDDFMSSVTHELRTPLTSIRAGTLPSRGSWTVPPRASGHRSWWARSSTRTGCATTT